MMRWLRKVLLPPSDDTEIDRAVFRQRVQVSAWDRVSAKIAQSERLLQGERRRQNVPHWPERRHG